jgi:predicted ATPase
MPAMPLTAVKIHGYRSVRSLFLPVDACAVFVGANGVGKTNLYKALGLLRAAADNGLTRAIAEEGGIESVMWAGKRTRHEPARLILKAYLVLADAGDGDDIHYTYEVEVGLPRPTDAAFHIEPLVKEERLILRQGRRDIVMMERKGPAVTLRGEDGRRQTVGGAVLPSETALATFRDGTRYPELEAVRRELMDWRLYHDFRTDAASPIRRPCHAIATPTLSPDGHDLAAVLATLFIIRQDTVDIDRAIDDAFPGAQLSAGDEGSWCRLQLQLPDVPRPFSVHELSDGTLKYLCLLGALMGYRLPSLVALNEPEASLHPSLLPALGRMIARAAQSTRLWIVTHSDALAGAIAEETGRRPLRVIKSAGATLIEELTRTGAIKDDDGEEDDAEA